MRRIPAGEFVRSLKDTTDRRNQRFALFLGAGCSVSSGIPAAGKLVLNRWLPRLRSLRAPNEPDLIGWARTAFPGFDPERPALVYGEVMGQLLSNDEARQREIEALCDGRDPAF